MVGFSWSLVHIHKKVQWVSQALLWGHRRRQEGGWKAEMPHWGQARCSGLMDLPMIPSFGLCPTLLSTRVNLPATFPVDLWLDPISSCHFYPGKKKPRWGWGITGVLPGAPDWCGSPRPGHPVPCCFAQQSPLFHQWLLSTFLERSGPGAGFVLPVR